MENINSYRIMVSFAFGVASFISPCILPLIPAYLSYITGASIDNLKAGGQKSQTLFLSLFFVLGFTLIFTLLGASASYLGSLLFYKKDLIRIIGSVFIVLFGFHLAGIIKIKPLYRQKKVNPGRLVSGYPGAFIIGVVFAFGWTPCVGPVLASILAMASMEETVFRGMVLLFSYSLGIGVPFILTALLLGKALEVFGKIKKHYAAIERITGFLLILIGILLFFNKLQVFIPA